MALALCLTVMPWSTPVKAAEADGFTYEVHDGKATITGTTLDNMVVMNIPATIDGYPVVSIGQQAFEDCTDLMDLTVAEGVQTIEAYAFYQCFNLTWVSLPNSLVSIEKNAFCNCRSLKDLWLGYGLKTIGYNAFAFCRYLDYLYIPYKVESIDVGAFYDCDSLTQVELPDSLKELGTKAFAMCDRLEYVVMPSELTYLGASVFSGTAFYQQSYNWKGDALCAGSYLLEAKVTISGSYTVPWYIEHIADEAFLNCDSLTEVILPDGLRIIGNNAFERCGSLQSITIPEGVTTIGDEAFYDCSSLTSIEVPGSVTSFGQDVIHKTAYYENDENWQNDVLYLGDILIECDSSVSGVFEVRKGTKIIASNAMKDVKKVTKIILPDTLAK